ncbi:MAG: hypothetical protein PF795_02005 [Kiritimatiellae bacterium]|jgi:outer membrane protein assembly factor BamE (lipoprotein component of BamABCDE complex)|nr:hypothetical protein [Kiritimatiellia bacterium]
MNRKINQELVQFKMKRKSNILIGTLLTLLGLVIIGGYLFVRSMEGETIYGDGYSSRNWKQIEKGMTKDEVLLILGPPLDNKIWWYSEDKENREQLLWSRPKEGEGYFSCIWFYKSIVIRKKIWFSD